MTVDCGIFVAVRLSCLISFLFIYFFKSAFHNTHNSGTVYERARSGTSGPHVSLCVRLYWLIELGVADSTIFLAGGTLVGGVAEP